ncbi:unnamed protein product [Notodromas monacha]|uniref:Peptidoglycan-recognition protein n=1 Tax=Notodromas monacha TaxID=399045 RepID=A0A7R9BEP0_9CRUS|nr:unnamed protein product [Notodromas monacha]CAG0913905.1 unnamed protein product [Notodromas monacha]
MSSRLTPRFGGPPQRINCLGHGTCQYVVRRRRRTRRKLRTRLLVRSFQNQHMDVNGWNDIGYRSVINLNSTPLQQMAWFYAQAGFVIGGDGSIFKGRGWDKVGAHTPGYNFDGLGICLIGNFVSKTPTSAQLKAAKELIACGVEKGKIKSNYKLIGHRQAVSTACPGQKLYDIIKGWPHWVNV